MKPKRAGIYLGAVLVITADTIRRIFGDSRPIDIAMLIIELLVLLLIAAEGVVNIFHWHSKRSTTSRLRQFLAQGQDLYDNPPPPQASEQEGHTWEAKVQDWTKTVYSFLSEKAKLAAPVFDHAPPVFQTFTHISIRIEQLYFQLDGRLKTLLSIMEKPNVYF